MHRFTRGFTLAGIILTSLAAQAKGPSDFNADDATARQAGPSSLLGQSSSGHAARTPAGAAGSRFRWAPRAATAFRTAQQGAENQARAYLAHYAAELGVARATFQAAKATTHELGGGARLVQFTQQLGGVDVFGARLGVLLTSSGRLVAISGELFAEVGRQRVLPFRLSHAAALARALGDAYRVSAKDLAPLAHDSAGYRSFTLKDGRGTATLQAPARVKQLYYRLDSKLVPAYYAEFLTRSAGSPSNAAYAVIVAADAGTLLYRQELTHDVAFKYRVWAETTDPKTPLDGPAADFSPHPTGLPDSSAPGPLAPALIEMEGFNHPPGDLPDPWLPAGARESNGNNVDAYSDRDQTVDADDNVVDDGFTNGDYRAEITAPLTFDRVFDVTKDPADSPDQVMAAVTQLFYVNNWLHDYWYDSGFNELSLNAQRSNYGRGGLGNDPLLAEAQDSAQAGERNNANMSVFADGASPRMQMYVYNGRDVERSLALSPNPTGFVGTTDTADFGAQTFEVAAEGVLAADGVEQSSDGCQELPDVTGKIVVVEEGATSLCRGVDRANNAQDAGAVGLVFISVDENPVRLGDNPTLGVIIPGLTLTKPDGDLLLAQMQAGATTISMKRTAGVARDGTIDNQIVAHEWGHYLHLRLLPCGGLSCGGMSEGWGDFVMLHMTARPEDNVDGVYGTVGYTAGLFGDNPYYFGDRRYPYTTDLTKNPLTFKHIKSSEALPDDVPVSLTVASPDNAEVHNQGEVWASLLHEVHANLLRESSGPTPRLSWEDAQRRMADYVVAGLKLAPLGASYTDQRDALLAAALARDPDDFEVMAAGFAKRGLGSCAVAPIENEEEAVEDFSLAGNLQFARAELDDSGVSCDDDGRLDVGETGKLRIMVRNTGLASVAGAVAKISTDAPALRLADKKLDIPELGPTETLELEVEATLDDTLTKTELEGIAITLTAPDGCTLESQVELTTRVNSDSALRAATSDAMEADVSAWSTLDVVAFPEPLWQRTGLAANDESNHLWWGADSGAVSDTSLISPPLDVSTTKDFVVELEHAYAFETSPEVLGGPDIHWDGALIEVSLDNGASWEAVTKYGAVPGYTGTIGDIADSPNPLSGQPGFVGATAGAAETPIAFEALRLDFGKNLAGETALLRFRIGTDGAQGALGWLIDDVTVTGITNKPFSALRADAGHCDAGAGGSSGSGGSGAGGSAGEGGSAGASGSAGSGGDAGMGGADGGSGGEGTSGSAGTGGVGPGPDPLEDEDGCDCALVGARPSQLGSGALAGLLVALTALKRRRTRRRAS